jgi:hypothetical protein
MTQTLLLGLINPTLKIPVQTNEFSEQIQWLEANYMLVEAQTFPMGSETVIFTVIFGQTKQEQGIIVEFNPVKTQQVILSGSSVENWGTDDSEILYAVAAELEITVEQIVMVNLSPNPIVSPYAYKKN